MRERAVLGEGACLIGSFTVVIRNKEVNLSYTGGENKLKRKGDETLREKEFQGKIILFGKRSRIEQLVGKMTGGGR